MSAPPPAAPLVLSVAGKDPSRGAGVDADMEALERAGARGHGVVATWTDQDGRRVAAFGPRPRREWVPEALAGLALSPRVLKTGLLVEARQIRAVVALARRARERGAMVVVDPVLAASGGERFVRGAALDALFGLFEGAIATPNALEAAELTGRSGAELARDLGARVEAAKDLLRAGARAVVLKGGHGLEDPVRDLVLEPGGAPLWLARPRIPGASLHGSGCRFAAFLAGRLALGDDLSRAAEAAGHYLSQLLQRGS